MLEKEESIKAAAAGKEKGGIGAAGVAAAGAVGVAGAAGVAAAVAAHHDGEDQRAAPG